MSTEPQSEKTPLGQLIAQDPELLVAFERILDQVQCWDMTEAGPGLEAQLAKHGIKYRKVWKLIKGNPKNRYLTYKLG